MYRISALLLEEHAQGVGVVVWHGGNQFPALRPGLVEFRLRALVDLAAEHLVRQFHHFVLPAFAHGLLSFFPVAGPSFFGSRPALRSESRSTYSYCGFRLRSSMSDQDCPAARHGRERCRARV